MAMLFDQSRRGVIARKFVLTVPQLTLALAQQLGRSPEGVTAGADERNVIIYTRWGYDWLNLADNIEINTEDGRRRRT